MDTSTVNVKLDAHDCNKMAKVMQALTDLENDGNIRINTVSFTIYGEHKVRASRRGRWNPLKVTKITRLW